MSGKGNPGLVAALTVAATLGGLLFGYDTAVISGVTDAITHNFVLPRHLAESQANILSGHTNPEPALNLKVEAQKRRAHCRRQSRCIGVRRRSSSWGRRRCCRSPYSATGLSLWCCPAR